MELVFYPNKILREKCEEVTDFDESLDKTVLDMFSIMYKKNGAGLAASQVGIKKRIIAVYAGEGSVAIINPKIIKKEGSETEEEGCLSFPSLFLKIKRAKKIKAEGQNTKGKRIEIDVEGLISRALQHEIDHLDGILFIDRIGFWKKWRLKRRLKKLLPGQKER